MTSPFVTQALAHENPDDTHTRLSAGSNMSVQALLGKRLAVKDLFHIAGLPTSAGNPDWLKSHPIPLSTHSNIMQLLALGARYVGKTITDELAYSLNGQNIHYGTPTNPVVPEHLPGGSSSGSAVAVALDEADIGLGTDTGGSIRVPASYNGLFGMRPSHGAVACDNMVALAPSFDTVGVMTRDLSALITTMTHLCKHPAEPQTTEHKNIDLADIKLGVLHDFINSASHSTYIHAWLAELRKTAIDISSLDFPLDPTLLSDVFKVLQGAEIWQQHGDWIETHSPHIASDIQTRLDWCSTISAAQIEDALNKQQQFKVKVANIFDEVDFVVLPTTPGIAPLLNAPEEELVVYRNTLLNLTAFAGLAGLPQIHLPKFKINGAPCGLSIVGPKYSDHKLMQFASLLDRNGL
ncbi:amidase [Agaribacter flavus]|uniref:Amidase n=1 Tax=Agaribacter flavus TaxID=1902781 RepID=A0ABV7FQQ5_9ALTE